MNKSAWVWATLAPLMGVIAAFALLQRGGMDANFASNALPFVIASTLMWLVALALHDRHPLRPLSRLLFSHAAVNVSQCFLASGDPLLFSIAWALRPVGELLFLWIILAYPVGALHGKVERWLISINWAVVVFLWFPVIAISDRLPVLRDFALCRGNCPTNALLLFSWPELAEILSTALRAIAIFTMVVAAWLMLTRLQRATPLLRRTLAPLLAVSIFRALTVASAIVVDVPFGIIPLTFCLIPLAIVWGLIWGRLYVGRALTRLVTGLRERPTVMGLQEVMARALDDPTLRVAYWIPEGGGWQDGQGHTVHLIPDHMTKDRALTLVRGALGQPVAALEHDVALQDEPGLVEAVISSVRVALESHRLDAELLSARAHQSVAIDAERERIGRDLHDGAQQRLIAMRMKLAVTAKVLALDHRRVSDLLQELSSDVDSALTELRTLAHGIAPPLLLEQGLHGALRDAAAHSPIPVECQIESVGRLHPAIERAVYFCILEALQNAAKHAGGLAVANVTLDLWESTLRFSVVDDGPAICGENLDPTGHGIANMRARIAELGGTLVAHHLPDGGFRVFGTVPL